MNTTIETITVEKAQQYLKTSLGNRPLSKTTIRSYADTMRQGKWMVNGMSIIFDVDGHLIDGHHRLEAVCAAGIPVTMSVCRGIETSAFTTFDCGLHRTLGQLLALQGVKHYAIVGSIVAANYALENTGRIYANNSTEMKGRHKRTNIGSYEVYSDDAAAYNEAASFADEMSRSANVLKKSWVGALYYFLQHTGGYEKEEVEFFFRNLCSLSESKHEQINLLRKRLIQEKLRGNVMQAPVIFALIAKTWNAYATGKKYTRLSFDMDKEEYPRLLSKKSVTKLHE